MCIRWSNEWSITEGFVMLFRAMVGSLSTLVSTGIGSGMLLWLQVIYYAIFPGSVTGSGWRNQLRPLTFLTILWRNGKRLSISDRPSVALQMI